MVRKGYLTCTYIDIDNKFYGLHGRSFCGYCYVNNEIDTPFNVYYNTI